MNWTAYRYTERWIHHNMRQMLTIIWKYTLGTMWDFTWDDLACLFLGFDEEPFLSAKKKPDIFLLLPRENWVWISDSSPFSSRPARLFALAFWTEVRAGNHSRRLRRLVRRQISRFLVVRFLDLFAGVKHLERPERWNEGNKQTDMGQSYRVEIVTSRSHGWRSVTISDK